MTKTLCRQLAAGVLFAILILSARVAVSQFQQGELAVIPLPWQPLATVATPTEMRDFVRQYIDPTVLRPDGQLVRRDAETPPETNTARQQAEAVKRSIAGAGFEPATSGL